MLVPVLHYKYQFQAFGYFHLNVIPTTTTLHKDTMPFPTKLMIFIVVF